MPAGSFEITWFWTGFFFFCVKDSPGERHFRYVSLVRRAKQHLEDKPTRPSSAVFLKRGSSIVKKARSPKPISGGSPAPPRSERRRSSGMWVPKEGLRCGSVRRSWA